MIKIDGTMKPFAHEIVVDDHSNYVSITQDHDMICISREQWPRFLEAVTRAANAKGWSGQTIAVIADEPRNRR